MRKVLDMSFGEVDTLNMLFDKLESLFDESQGYYESFLDTNNMYKQGKIADKEFFQRLGDYVVAYSALEFLSIKVIFEIRKSLKTGSANTQSPAPSICRGSRCRWAISSFSSGV